MANSNLRGRNVSRYQSSSRETYTELITRHFSVYPGVPCTIQLPNARLGIFLAELAVAVCHVLGVFPGQHRLLLGVPALHPCLLLWALAWRQQLGGYHLAVAQHQPTQKVDFANNIQLSLTLAALSIGLWWTFDRSRSGFGLGVGIAFLATLVSQLLVYNGVYQYTSPDFLYVRSWLPCIFFAGGITMGNIGRQLAMYECKVIAEKSHED
ncbi:hypothetical protein HGM15179_007263 [Zosterops borbonicus]|uniref:Insulin-induced gene protein n=1 Tax=Zosterops borbonicus TaxID=364589 RepID=A0A8K1GJ11_9PASS|nr:hypothetical protein HGM15179_007263 [Zosterops borbonicus]